MSSGKKLMKKNCNNRAGQRLNEMNGHKTEEAAEGK